MNAVSQLQRLHFMLSAENLQQLVMRLMLKSINLNRQLERQRNQQADCCDESQPSQSSGADLHPGDAARCHQHISIYMLQMVTDLISSVKDLLSWLNVAPFEGQQSFSRLRSLILEPSIQLAVNAQRDSFAVRPVDQIRKASKQLAQVCQSVVQDSVDSLTLIPASFLIVCLKPKCGELLGLHLVRDLSGMATIAGLKFQSPAHMCGKLEQGDQLVQVNRQTVVGWQLDKIVNILNYQRARTEVYLTVKKRPKHNSVHDQASFRTFRRHKRHVHTNWTASSRPGALPLLSTINRPSKITDTDEADAETDSNDNDEEESTAHLATPRARGSPTNSLTGLSWTTDLVNRTSSPPTRTTISCASLTRALTSSEQNLSGSMSGYGETHGLHDCQSVDKRDNTPFLSNYLSDMHDRGDPIHCSNTGPIAPTICERRVRDITEDMESYPSNHSQVTEACQPAVSTRLDEQSLVEPPAAVPQKNCPAESPRSATLLDSNHWRSNSEREPL